MNNEYSELTARLEEVGLEQISEMMIASTHNDSKRVFIKGVHYSNNIHYTQKDIFYVKRKTKQKEFYVRSDGDENTNLLLYSHVEEIVKDGFSGVFSIGSALNNKKEETILCICQVIDHSKLKQVQDVFNRQKIIFRKFENNHFAIKSVMIFANL
jgi:hypothetical protein